MPTQTTAPTENQLPNVMKPAPRHCARNHRPGSLKAGAVLCAARGYFRVGKHRARPLGWVTLALVQGSLLGAFAWASFTSGGFR